MSAELNSKRKYVKALLEKEIRAARTDYFTFLKFMSPPDFKWNWHHRVICQILQEWATTDKWPFLMLFMPPQHQKSTMLTEYLPAWCFGQNINEQAMLVMYNDKQAKKMNRKIRKIIMTKKYKRIFPGTRINEAGVMVDGQYVNNANEFEIVGGRGFMMSTGADGGIAGNPAKKAFIDDLIKNVKEANSKTFRDNNYDWYVEELEARLHNDSKVAFTITRRHEDDLAGRLIARDGLIEDGGKWKVIKFPAIKETQNNPLDPRKVGEALFPQLHSLERMLEKKSKNPRTFVGLYQQEPKAPEGNKFKRTWFNIITENEIPFNWQNQVMNFWIDGAYTKISQNDETGLLAEMFHNGNMYIFSAIGIRKELYEFLKYFPLYSKINHHRTRSKVYIELKASGHDMKSMMSKPAFGNYNCVPVNSKTVDLGKWNRAENAEPFVEGGKVFLIKGPWNEAFLEQVCAFPNGAHDDMLDVMCYAIDERFIKGDKARGAVYRTE